MKARLVLVDGTVFTGKSIGAEGTVCGNVVFTTAMSGFQEALTDPAYYGEILSFTDPLIANYGVNGEDDESAAVQCRGVIMKEPSDTPSNFRCTGNMPDYLASRGVVGIADIDTRALTRKLRDSGTMKGVITTGNEDFQTLFAAEDEPRPAMRVGVRKAVATDVPDAKGTVAVLDLGVKQSVIDGLAAKGYRVVRLPASATFAEIQSYAPDGILISNGPGRAADYPELIALAKEIVQSGVPTLAVGLGNLILALSQGFEVIAMPFGHHGNHPVKDLERDFVFAASPNVNECVKAESVKPSVAAITHVDMHDGAVEGLRYAKAPVIGLQFQPDNVEGGHNASYLFGVFAEMMKNKK